MFYDYMLVYQGSSIKSSLPALPIFLSALNLAAFDCAPQLPRSDPGTVWQAANSHYLPYG